MTRSDEFRVDAHVKVLDEAVAERAKLRGIDALVYAPHFTRLPEIRATAERHSDDELLVVPGREVFTGDWRNRKHVLAVGLDSPVPDFLTLDGAMAELERQGAAVLVPHPGFLTVSLSRRDVQEYADVVDAVETYNPKFLPHHERRATAIGADLGVDAFASSYAHLRGSVGEAWTAFEEPLEDEADLVAAFRDDRPLSVGHRTGFAHKVQRTLEFSHLGYENTVKKVDRIVLSGREPTHPGQPLYDGRFDDVRVY